MIELSEIFYSIQGESTFSGIPCIFIRLAGCNLRCSYCDTTYSYIKSFSLNPEEIIDKIIEYEPIRLVEVTGGEPLMQEEVYLLFELLKMKNYRILLETNGSICIKKVPSYVYKIVDVKCPGSNTDNSFLESNLQYLTVHDQVKFVISNSEDYNYAKSFLKKINTDKTAILFSPVPERLAPEILARWILRDRLNVRLQLQLHKLIWIQGENTGNQDG